ncbi:MAG: hypothetical protein FWH18_12255 [Marinilabiliaceae bacterium]|nr:hypothetical protein [Marinilabiliaceae bacterium]
MKKRCIGLFYRIINPLLPNTTYQSIEAGHEKWSRHDLTRPIIFQTHIDPVPEFIVKSNLRTLNMSRQDFFNVLFDILPNSKPSLSAKK